MSMLSIRNDLHVASVIVYNIAACQHVYQLILSLTRRIMRRYEYPFGHPGRMQSPPA